NAHSMQPVTALNGMASTGFSAAGLGALRLLLAVVLAVALAACNLPFGLGTASERALESGAEASLASSSFELAGTYSGPGVAAPVPQLPDFTRATAFKSTFLGSAVTQRADNFSVDGVDAVKLSGPRADLYIASASPNQLLVVQLKKGVVIDGIRDAEFKYSNFGKDFG